MFHTHVNQIRLADINLAPEIASLPRASSNSGDSPLFIIGKAIALPAFGLPVVHLAPLNHWNEIGAWVLRTTTGNALARHKSNRPCAATASFKQRGEREEREISKKEKLLL